jgi:hypothetical protein
MPPPPSRRWATSAMVAGRLGEAARHRTEAAVPREIEAGAAKLTPASPREGSRELRVSHHLLNDFTKGDKPASALVRNQYLIQGNRLKKAKPRIRKLEFSFFMLLRSQSI